MAPIILSPSPASCQTTTDSLLAWYAREFIAATTPEQRTAVAMNVRNHRYTGTQFSAAIKAAQQPAPAKKRTIRNPAKWIGKHIDTTKWELPEGYQLCAYTGKLYAEAELMNSFGHHYFDKTWLIAKGIYIEDAAWLSESGYDAIMAVLEREGLYEAYLNRPCNPNSIAPLNQAVS